MIAIVFIGELKYCPYVSKYIQVIEENQKDYEVLFWNRGNDEVNFPQNYIHFNKKSKLNKHPLLKIVDFIQFSRWLKRTITKRGYEKIIVLSTLSGIFIAKILVNKYKNKYIFDIRDYSYEKIRLFYKIEEKIIRNSNFTCISSQGFKYFLPKDYSYVMAHNFNYSDMKYRGRLNKKKKGSVIKLVWIGSVRYFQHQSKILYKLKNDDRFLIIYHGTGPQIDIFKQYCEDNQIKNVIFTGEYNNTEKLTLLAGADILNNSYGKKNEICIKHAISNKYYDGLVFGIPQLVENNSFKHEKIYQVGVGIGLDIDSEYFADKLYDYYFSIDENKFNDCCDRELETIIEEDAEYIRMIRNFVRE